MTTIARGSLFAGRFTILRLVQQDPRGEVYAARSEPDQEICRLRILPADTRLEGSADRREAESFLSGGLGGSPPIVDDEAAASFAAAMARIPAHEALPALIASGVDEGRPFAATRWVEGSSLVDVVRARGRLPWAEARVLLADLGAALVALHAAGVDHGALSPDLVLVDAPTAGGRLRPRVLDAVLLRFLAPPPAAMSDAASFASLADLVIAGRREPREDVPLPPGFVAWLAGCLSPRGGHRPVAAAVDDLDAIFAEADRRSRAAEEAARAEEERARAEADRVRRVDEAGWAAILADEGGEDLVSIRTGEGTGIAGGVVFDLPSWVPPGQRRSIVRAMIAAARALAGEARAGGAPIDDAGYQAVLDALDVCATIDAGGLTLEHRHEAWVTSHEKGWVTSPYAHLPREALPLDLAAFSAMVEAVAGAASAYDTSQTTCACSRCGGSFAAIDMHDASTCHRCAEIHLGIVH